MRGRLLVLVLLAVTFAVGFAVCTAASDELSYRAQLDYTDLQNDPPTLAQQEASTRLYQQSYGLQLVMTPLATGALLSALAVPAVLARRWQLRE